MEPNSVTNNLSDKNIESTYYDVLITKEGNRDGYTERQYQDTKRAWKLYLNIRVVVLIISNTTYAKISSKIVLSSTTTSIEHKIFSYMMLLTSKAAQYTKRRNVYARIKLKYLDQLYTKRMISHYSSIYFMSINYQF